MASENLCLYNKYGHCKFTVTCCHLHTKEICENPNCETEKCFQRHPRKCKFFEEFRRCKFGNFCSFFHRAQKQSEIGFPNSQLIDVKTRLATLENRMEEKIVKSHVCILLSLLLQLLPLVHFPLLLYLLAMLPSLSLYRYLQLVCHKPCCCSAWINYRLQS